MFMFRLAVSQYSSCPLILFAVTAHDSQEASDFYHDNDDTLSLFPPSALMRRIYCLKGSFLLVLSHRPLISVKN